MGPRDVSEARYGGWCPRPDYLAAPPIPSGRRTGWTRSMQTLGGFFMVLPSVLIVTNEVNRLIGIGLFYWIGCYVRCK